MVAGGGYFVSGTHVHGNCMRNETDLMQHFQEVDTCDVSRTVVGNSLLLKFGWDERRSDTPRRDSWAMFATVLLQSIE